MLKNSNLKQNDSTLSPIRQVLLSIANILTYYSHKTKGVSKLKQRNAVFSTGGIEKGSSADDIRLLLP